MLTQKITLRRTVRKNDADDILFPSNAENVSPQSSETHFHLPLASRIALAPPVLPTICSIGLLCSRVSIRNHFVACLIEIEITRKLP